MITELKECLTKVDYLIGGHTTPPQAIPDMRIGRKLPYRFSHNERIAPNRIPAHFQIGFKRAEFDEAYVDEHKFDLANSHVRPWYILDWDSKDPLVTTVSPMILATMLRSDIFRRIRRTHVFVDPSRILPLTEAYDEPSHLPVSVRTMTPIPAGITHMRMLKDVAFDCTVTGETTGWALVMKIGGSTLGTPLKFHEAQLSTPFHEGDLLYVRGKQTHFSVGDLPVGDRTTWFFFFWNDDVTVSFLEAGNPTGTTNDILVDRMIGTTPWSTDPGVPQDVDNNPNNVHAALSAYPA